MEKKKSIRGMGIVSLAVVIVASARTDAEAAFSTAVSSFTQSSINVGPTQSLGFDFKEVTQITINELGAYQASSTSITQGQVVYLYDLTTSTLLASTSLTGPFTTGNFNYGGIGPVTLNSTDTYSIFSVYTGSSAQYGQASTLNFSSDIAIVPIGGFNTGYTQGSAPVPPSTGYFAGIIAVDFQYSPTIVPEPASVALMGLGMVGVAVARRRIARRSA